MSASPIASRIPAPALRLHATHRVDPAATSCALLASDSFAVLAATWLGVSIWSIFNPAISTANSFTAPVVFLLFLSVYAAFGLYSPSGLTPCAELRRSVLATGVVSLALAAAVFLSKDASTYSRGAFLVSSVLAAAFVPAGRSLLRAACASRSWWGVPVFVLGAGNTASLLIQTLKAQPELGLKPVACFDDDPARLGYCAGVPVIGTLDLAAELAPSLHIRNAILAMPGVSRVRLMEILEHHGAAFSRLLVIPNLFGIASLWVSTIDLAGVLGLEVKQNLLNGFNRRVKRILDCLLAIPLFIVALPVLLLSALWIRLLSRGRPLFAQIRAGENQAPLRMWKLRTMHPRADDILHRHLDGNPTARSEWNRFFKLRDDPRVIPGIGRLLRRSSLDELPQLWNVLKGEMSLVGPRPFPQYHLDQFSPEFRAFRARVKPGLTGLWQVAARSNGDLAVQETLDTYYIRNWSLWLDLYILARTLHAVFRGKGAY
jgi:Undecaprenyl-phosphate galactose phosphotransferase WbaP